MTEDQEARLAVGVDLEEAFAEAILHAREATKLMREVLGLIAADVDTHRTGTVGHVATSAATLAQQTEVIADLKGRVSRERTLELMIAPPEADDDGL